MQGYTKNIENVTLRNNYFRNVLYTNATQQLVVMSLEPGESIPLEKHNGSQFFRVEAGRGYAIVGKKKVRLANGTVLIIPKDVAHKIINSSKTESLKMYTIYSPPQHKPGAKQKRGIDDKD